MSELATSGAPSGVFHRGALRLSGVLLAAAALLGCPEEKTPKPEARDGAAAARDERPTAAGLRLVLPSGWTAQPENEKTLVIGPRGRAVMRIERSSLEELPAVAELEGAFSRQFPGATTERDTQRETDELTLWRVRLKAEDAGVSWSAVLGAKKVGETIFLCSSLPGASDREIDAAADTCERLGE